MPDLKPQHNHWRRKCAICDSLMGWCKCSGTNPDSGSMVTLHGICQKCVDAALIKKDASIDLELKRLGYYFNEKKELRIDPKTPIKFKEFIFKAGPFFYYFVNEDEMQAKYTCEFTEAGNFKRYSFIPKNEFWIDIAQKPDDKKLQHSFLHETVEVLYWIAFDSNYDTSHYMAEELENATLSGIYTPVKEYLND